jgi:integral membrane protein (TIGR01906 family)
VAASPGTWIGWRLGVGLATALGLLGIVLLPLLTPLYMHAGLRAAGSAAILGLSEDRTAAISDQTVGELVFGPATFAFPVEPGGPPFYDASEASHLRDARTVLWAFLGVVGVAVVALVAAVALRGRRAWPWRAMATGGLVLAGTLAVVGVVFTFAFDQAFTLFHEILFSGGNWSFDPRTERMVQLYPTPFWELTATVLAVVAIALGLAVRVGAERVARRRESSEAAA